jgi:hypothetical protein
MRVSVVKVEVLVEGEWVVMRKRVGGIGEVIFGG